MDKALDREVFVVTQDYEGSLWDTALHCTTWLHLLKCVAFGRVDLSAVSQIRTQF